MNDFYFELRFCLEKVRSKFGHNRLSHLHYRLHMRLEKAWNNRFIKRACFSCFVLHLVYVSIFVPNSRWDMLHRFIEAFNERDKLGPNCLHGLITCCVQQSLSASLEVAALVQALMVRYQMLHRKKLQLGLHQYLSI